MNKIFLNQLFFFKFLFHVKKFFSLDKKFDSENLILVEFNPHKPALLGLLHLMKVLRNNYRAKIIVYYPQITFGIFKYLKRFFGIHLIAWKQLLIYKFIGCKFKLYFQLNNTDIPFVKKKYAEILEKIDKKENLSSLILEDILVGDLFYDTYTRYNSEPTINLNDSHFKKKLFEYFREFYYWFNLIKNNPIKSIIVTHPVYNLAIPLRIGQKFNIPVYIGSINFLQYFDNSRKHLWDNNYKNYYDNLSKDDQLKALNYSKIKLENKFNPKSNKDDDSQNSIIQRDIHWDRLDAFSSIKNRNFLKKNGKPNIVILAHCFYDAPHNEGEWLFADFYEWVNYLFKLSKNTDFNWYIKKHPASVNQKLNDRTIDLLLKDFPNITLLKDVNNTELINDNVSLILTAWGSAGYEFSYHGVPVILASNKCSYSGYNFTYKPKNLDDFDYSIKNFRNINFSFDKKEIYRFYFNQILTYWDLFPEFQKYKSQVLNSELAKNDYIFKLWIENFTEETHLKNIEDVSDFVLNKKNQLITSKIN